MKLTAAAIHALPVNNDARKAIRACTDIIVLREALELEQASKAPRKARIDQIQLRIDMLVAQNQDLDQLLTPAEVASVNAVQQKQALPPPVPVAQLVAEEIAAGAAPALATAQTVHELVDAQPAQAPQAPPQAPVDVQPDAQVPAPDAAPQAPQAPDDSPVLAFAKNFLRAIGQGDARLVEMLLGIGCDARYTHPDLAQALVQAQQAQTQPTRTRARKPQATAGETKPSDIYMERVRKAISLATPQDDGSLVLTSETMTQAGFPASWQKHATCWCAGSDQRTACLACGYEVKMRSRKDAPPVLVLTCLPPPQAQQEG